MLREFYNKIFKKKKNSIEQKIVETSIISTSKKNDNIEIDLIDKIEDDRIQKSSIEKPLVEETTAENAVRYVDISIFNSKQIYTFLAPSEDLTLGQKIKFLLNNNEVYGRVKSDVYLSTKKEDFKYKELKIVEFIEEDYKSTDELLDTNQKKTSEKKYADSNFCGTNETIKSTESEITNSREMVDGISTDIADIQNEHEVLLNNITNRRVKEETLVNTKDTLTQEKEEQTNYHSNREIDNYNDKYYINDGLIYNIDNNYKISKMKICTMSLLSAGISRTDIAKYFEIEYVTVKKAVQQIKKTFNASSDDELIKIFNEKYPKEIREMVIKKYYQSLENYENIASKLEEKITDFEMDDSTDEKLNENDEPKQQVVENNDKIIAYFKKKNETNLMNNYNKIYIVRFIEKIMNKTYVLKNDSVENYEFIKSFDELLKILNDRQKNIILDKYGIKDGEVKTAISICNKYELTPAGINSSIQSSIRILSNSPKLETVLEFLKIGFEDEVASEEDVDFIMGLFK